MTLLSTYQPLIAAILGIAALIGGALLNAHLNRMRDDRETRRQDHRFANALFAEALNASFKAEACVAMIEEALAGRSASTYGSVITYAPPHPHLLDKLDENIGRLPTELATVMINLSQNVGDIRENFQAMTNSAVASGAELKPIHPETLNLLKGRLQQVITIVDKLKPLMKGFMGEESRPNLSQL